jgi:hypothetical protein
MYDRLLSHSASIRSRRCSSPKVSPLRVAAGGGPFYVTVIGNGFTASSSLGAAIPPSAEYGVVMHTGLAAGDGLLVVPNGTRVTACTLSTSP